MTRIKKVHITAAVIFVCLLTGIIAFTASGKKPFEKLSSTEIQSVSVRLTPPDLEIQLSEDEIHTLVTLLSQNVVYRKDNSYSNYSGQDILFTITKRDQTTLTVHACNPFLIINETGYRCKYEPCEALSAFANGLIS